MNPKPPGTVEERRVLLEHRLLTHLAASRYSGHATHVDELVRLSNDLNSLGAYTRLSERSVEALPLLMAVDALLNRMSDLVDAAADLDPDESRALLRDTILPTQHPAPPNHTGRSCGCPPHRCNGTA